MNKKLQAQWAAYEALVRPIVESWRDGDEVWFALDSGLRLQVARNQLVVIKPHHPDYDGQLPGFPDNPPGTPWAQCDATLGLDEDLDSQEESERHLVAQGLIGRMAVAACRGLEVLLGVKQRYGPHQLAGLAQVERPQWFKPYTPDVYERATDARWPRVAFR